MTHERSTEKMYYYYYYYYSSSNNNNNNNNSTTTSTTVFVTIPSRNRLHELVTGPIKDSYLI